MFLQSAEQETGVAIHESFDMINLELQTVLEEGQATWFNLQSEAMQESHVAILSENADKVKETVGKFFEGVKKWFKEQLARLKTAFSKLIDKIVDVVGSDKQWLDRNGSKVAAAKDVKVKMYEKVASGAAIKQFQLEANQTVKRASRIGGISFDELKKAGEEFKSGQRVAVEVLGTRKEVTMKGADIVKSLNSLMKLAPALKNIAKIREVAAKGFEAQLKTAEKMQSGKDAGKAKAGLMTARELFNKAIAASQALMAAYNSARSELMAAARSAVSGSSEKKPASEEKAEPKAESEEVAAEEQTDAEPQQEQVEDIFAIEEDQSSAE